MRHTKISIALLTGISIFALVAGWGKPQPTKISIAVVSQTSFTSLPVTVAEVLGYFKDENLDVTLQDVNGPASAVQALSGGSADVAASIPDVILLAAVEGKQFRSFALMANMPGLALVAAPGKEKEIRTFNDLRGKTVGIVSLGSSAEIYLRYLATRRGLGHDDIHFVQVGSPAARIAALEAQKVDAAVISEPALSILRRKYGTVPLLADCRTEAGTTEWFGVPQYPGSVVFATPAWLASHRSEARGIAKAVVRAQRWLHSQPPAEIAKKMPESFKPDPAAFVDGLTASIPSYSKDGYLADAYAQHAWEVITSFSEKAKNSGVDVKTLFTNEYLPH